MSMKRREFLTVLSALGAGVWPATSCAKPRPTLLSASDDAEGKHFLAGEQGQVELPLRGHGVTIHPRKPATAVVFARRPGNQCFAVDWRQWRISATFDALPGHGFSGHGVFSADGSVLYCAEMDHKTGAGTITVRDGRDYRILRPFSSGGVEPHDLRLLADGETLVVANGCILTRPETGRKKLNLATMHSNLTLLNTATGQIQASYTAPWPQASLRHLALGRDGTLAIAVQYQREAVDHQDVIPLAGFWRAGAEKIRFLTTPETLIEQLHDYVGSVAIHDASQTAGFTSPRGNLAAFWRLNGDYAGHHRMRDVCGLGVTGDHFVLTNSSGQVRYLRADTLREERTQSFAATRWDNHLTLGS